MTKNNHLIAEYDDAGNFTPIGKPGPYDDLRAELLKLIDAGAAEEKKVCLISLRAGVRKKRRIPAKAKAPAAKKKASTSKDS